MTDKLTVNRKGKASLAPTKIALSATLGLALAFTLSCGEHGGDDDSGPGIAGNPSSSSGNISSDGVIYNPDGSFTDARDGKRYKIAEIGTQIWMAENLGYNAPDSKCYDNDLANCAKYGRLYDWATAMDIEAKYNKQKWNGGDVKHKGICPSGWHIPSERDWGILMQHINPSCSLAKDCDNAETKLKATSDWNKLSNGNSGNGTDDYNFSALPGGKALSNGNSVHVGDAGYWLSATDYRDDVYEVNMNNSPGRVYRDLEDKDIFRSIRCLQDNSGADISSSSRQTGEILGTPVTYVGHTYKTVVIGAQTWMSENLNYAVEGSKCYDDDLANCAKYGRLYDWATAMDIEAKYNEEKWNGSDVKHKGICPSGWHIPSDAEWTTLTDFLSDESKAGTKLKTISGWLSNGNGTDDYGFSALPGKYDGGCNLSSSLSLLTGCWWSATEAITGITVLDNKFTHSRMITFSSEDVLRNFIIGAKKDYISVRCIKD